MVKKFFLLGLILFFVTGCASSMGSFEHSLSTNVTLEKGNFRIVKSNAVGISRGFKLLGILPMTQPSYIAAMDRINAQAGLPEGRAVALTNVVKERTNSYFILFSVPTIRIRADIVEFQDESRNKHLAER